MNRKLFLLKLAHTIIWAFYVCVIFYIIYKGIVNELDFYLLTAISLVMLEGIVLAVFKWRCPLTIIGYKYTENTEVGFDIFLPRWLAKNNKLIFTSIFIIGLLLVAYRIL